MRCNLWIVLPRREMYLPCNMKIVPCKIIKQQHYSIIQPREIVNLILTMKQPLYKKTFFTAQYYRSTKPLGSFTSLIGNLPNKPLKDSLWELWHYTDHYLSSFLHQNELSIIVKERTCFSSIENTFFKTKSR